MLAIPTQCAPQVAPETIVAIVRVESRGDPLAVHDNTTGRSYRPANTGQAQALLEALLRARHSVDAGLMQIDSSNFFRLHVTPRTVFIPCVNVAAGGAILQAAWTQAARAGMAGQAALWAAVQAYNSGNLRGAPSYASSVWAAAGQKARRGSSLEPTAQEAAVAPAFAAPGVSFSHAWTSAVTWKPT